MNTLLSILVPTSFIGLVCVIIKHYDNVKKIFADFLSFCAATFGWFKSKSAQSSVETVCQQTIKELNSIVPELNMPNCALKWVKKDEHGNVILKPGEAIVLLKYNRDNCQNIINTTSLYVKKTLLPISKSYMDEGVKKAVDFSVVRSFLNHSQLNNFVIPQYLEDSKGDINQYRETFDKVSKIEKEGLFSRVLLREYAIWGNKIATEIPNDKHKEESKDFLDFIYNIASREYDELTPLTCVLNNVKVAVLLVAKYETFYEKGIDPYVRRIKEGFSKGIKTFYLLARNDKIDILNDVYGKLIASGNYELQNGPKVYKDEFGRDNICYCIEVKKNSDFAKAYSEIDEAIKGQKTIEVNITNVFADKIQGDYNGIDVKIPITEISVIPNLKLRNFYTVGMTILAIPLSVEAGGVIVASLLSTTCDPKSLVDNQYAINNQVVAIVEYADDDFIKLRIKDSDQQAIAFRRDLTYSRFGFLHHLFPVGSELTCIIKEIDYVSNVLIVGKTPLDDPWNRVNYNKDDVLQCEICNIKDTCFETELPGDYYAILPFSELAWIDSKICELKQTIKRNTIQTVRIKSVSAQKRIIVLTMRNRMSDYQSFYESIKDNNYQTQCVINEVTSYGLYGIINKELKIVIPLSECHIGDSEFSYKIGKSYQVKIIEVAKDKRSFVGTFKPFITSPLKAFTEQYHIGHIFTDLRINNKFKSGVGFVIKYSNNKEARATLYNSDVSDLCFVNDVSKLFETSFTCPLCLKSVDEDRNNVVLSLKNVLINNREKIEDIDLGDVVYGRVVGHKDNNYVVIIEGIWTDAYCESERKLDVGDRIKMIKASSSIFCESN